MQMRTRVAGVLAATACAVGMMAAPAFAAPSHHGGDENNVGNISILSGNIINIPIEIPINVCGNAIAILGSAEAGCVGGATAWLSNG